MRLKSTWKPRKGLVLFASLFASQLSFQLSTLSSLENQPWRELGTSSPNPPVAQLLSLILPSLYLFSKALFIIHLEKSVNRLRWFRNTPEKSLIEFPAVKKKRYEKFLDHVYFGGHIDTLAKIDGKKEVQRKVEEESATAQNDHLETLFATKIANTHSMLRLEFTEMFEKMEENHREDVATRKAIEEKMDKMFEKWS